MYTWYFRNTFWIKWIEIVPNEPVFEMTKGNMKSYKHKTDWQETGWDTRGCWWCRWGWRLKRAKAGVKYLQQIIKETGYRRYRNEETGAGDFSGISVDRVRHTSSMFFIFFRIPTIRMCLWSQPILLPNATCIPLLSANPFPIPIAVDYKSVDLGTRHSESIILELCFKLYEFCFTLMATTWSF